MMSTELCREEHTRLLSGVCPWCGWQILRGEPVQRDCHWHRHEIAAEELHRLTTHADPRVRDLVTKVVFISGTGADALHLLMAELHHHPDPSLQDIARELSGRLYE